MVADVERRLAGCSANTYGQQVLVRALMKAMNSRRRYANSILRGGGDEENIAPTGVTPRAPRVLWYARRSRQTCPDAYAALAGSGDNQVEEDAHIGSSGTRAFEPTRPQSERRLHAAGLKLVRCKYLCTNRRT